MKEIEDRKSPASPIQESATARSLHTLVQQVETYRRQIFQDKQKLEEVRGQLRESYSRFSELYQLAPIGFLTLDRQGRIRELNEKAARLLGFPSTWLIDRPFLVFVAKEDVRRFLTFLTRSIREEDTHMIELQLFVGGHQWPVQILMRTSQQSGLIHHQMTIVDLTDIKSTEKQLQDSLDSWHALVHSAPDVIMTLDWKGHIVFVNRPIWGCSVRALLGTRLIDYLPRNERPRLQKCIQDVLSSGERAACEILGVNGDSQAWFSFSFGPLPSPAPAKRTVTLTIREISEHKRAEETLRSSGEQLREFAARLEAVREEERARVAREIHDELGQALTILKLDLSWLQSKTPRSQSTTRKKMNAMIQHVDETIERVRRIASELRPSILDDLGLVPAIEWQLKEFQKRTGIRCRLQSNVAEQVGLSSEASAAIFRVVQEALTNVVRHAKAATVQVSALAQEDIFRIAIVDNGKGITREEISNLKSLGIVGMKERVARIGGEFNIESRRRKGTRVEIILPIKP